MDLVDGVDNIVLSDDSSDSDQTLGGDEVLPVTNYPPQYRNGPIEFPEHINHDYIITAHGWRVKIGDCVELKADSQFPQAFRNGDFIRIIHIFENSTSGKIFLRGWRFRRNSLMDGHMVPTLLNEIIMLIDQDLDDSRPPLHQGMETVSLEDVFKKRKLILTNDGFPAHSFRTHTSYSASAPDATAARDAIKNSSELVCRLVAITRFETGNNRVKYNAKIAREALIGKLRVHKDALIRRLRSVEADSDFAAQDSMLMYQWLGYFPWRQEASTRQPRRKLADVCCGAGFATLGAKKAGFDVAWALDINSDAVATFTLNHPETDVFCIEVGEFIHFAAFTEHHVAVLHLSFPCQFFSPAHTREGRNDDANTAASFALRELITRIKPRIVTFEQTSGLLTHHPEWLQAILRMFTETGYNVEWKVQNLAELGLAHERKRLIIIASCPGSALPPYPEPTHGPNGHYAFTTIAKALEPLERITRPVPHHNPSTMDPIDMPSYSAHTILRNTVTTSGTKSYHPSGLRKFTVCEAMLLQSAPIDFKFPRDQNQTTVMRQTGNAFPTTPACAIFTSIWMALDREDEEMRRERWV